MGGTAEEVVSDYMTTYSNFYGVMPEDARYAAIANSNIVKSLQIAFVIADLYHADLAQCATVYLRQLGLAESEITALKANLSATEKASQSAAVYVVMPGDCLWNIARRYYGSGNLYPRLAEANHIRNPHLIRAGQTLLIPAI